MYTTTNDFSWVMEMLLIFTTRMQNAGHKIFVALGLTGIITVQ